MKDNQRRVLTRVHTRKLDRGIAKDQMKRKGIQRISKHDHVRGYTISGKQGQISRVDSYFAGHWREYC